MTAVSAVRHRWRLVVLAGLLLLGGCALLQEQLDPPGVSLSQVRLLEAGLLEQRFGLTVRVQNPNPVPLAVTGFAYRLDLDGRELGRGVSPDGFRIGAYGETELDLELAVSAIGLVGTLHEWMRRPPDAVSYTLTGELAVPKLSRPLEFERTGSVSLRLSREPGEGAPSPSPRPSASIAAPAPAA